MQKERIFFCALVVALLSACATVSYDYRSEAAKNIAAADWSKAYEQVEFALGSDDGKVRVWGYDLLMANPPTRVAASQVFGDESVEKVFLSYDPITANDLLMYRLSLYSKYASDSEIKEASERVERAFQIANKPRLALLELRRNVGAYLAVTDHVFGQLTQEDQGQLKLRFPQMKIVPQAGVGKVVSVQVLDRSRQGTSVGAQLGAAYGQAAYIDRSISSRNYSATGQVSAGLIGAIVGSALDKRPESKYLLNYGAQLPDGTITGVIVSSPDGISAPIGQCIFTNDALQAPSYLCSDTIVDFLKRTADAGRSKGDSPPQQRSAGVKCKISEIATLTLNLEECRRLGGEVLSR